MSTSKKLGTWHGSLLIAIIRICSPVFYGLNACGTFLIHAKYEDENSRQKHVVVIIYHVIDSKTPINCALNVPNFKPHLCSQQLTMLGR